MSKWSLVQCQNCHGEGGQKEVILDDGSGPMEYCGYCLGTGLTTRWMNCWIMRWACYRLEGAAAPQDADCYEHGRVMERYAAQMKAQETT